MPSRSKFIIKLYSILIGMVFLIILFTPFLVKKFSIVGGEEYSELILLAILLAAGYLLIKLYGKEVGRYRSMISDLEKKKNELRDTMQEALLHIGKLNVQISEIKSIFTDIKKYPENKKEMENMLQYFSDKILSIINVDWGLLRIVDLGAGKTMEEKIFFRGDKKTGTADISNSDLLSGNLPEGYSTVKSTEDNFSVNTYCVLPRIINKEQKIFTEAIVNQIEMLFIIFASTYYKK